MHATYDDGASNYVLSPLVLDQDQVPRYDSWGSTTANMWKIDDLTADEFGRMVRPTAECDEVLDMLTDGWNQPNPDLFQYFRHTYNAVANIEDTLEHKRKTVERLFNELKRNGIEGKLDKFLHRK